MLWLNAHARTRRRLSPYIDGRLSPPERTALEAHLVACEACRRELDELRATVSAVGGLADVEPPRSFALTPRLLEQRAEAPPSAPLATGMRLSGAAVAFALAVVVIGDLGGVGGGMGDGGDVSRDSAALRSMQMESATQSDERASGAPAPAATGAAEEYAADAADRASPDGLAASADKTEECPAGGTGTTAAGTGTGAGGAGGPVTASSPTAEPAPTPSPIPAPDLAGALTNCAPAVAGVAPEASTTANVKTMQDSDEGGTAASPELGSTGDSGVSSLTILEIVLASALVALLGGIGIEYILRRRAA